MDNIVIPVICGATGSGKSDLAYSIFNDIDFELISADAFQIYKGLDIGTAKPSKDICEKIKHHMIDIVDTDGFYTAGDWVKDAEKSIEDVLLKGKLPVVVGGTGLYIQALRDGIFNTPSSDEKYREELRACAREKGTEYLYSQLELIDSVYAKKIHSNDLVRIIRAMEVYHTTGLPITEAHDKFHQPPKFSYEIMVLERDRAMLYQSIDKRVKKMIDSGWVEEVEKLLSEGFSISIPAFRAIGYKEVACVAGGTLSIDEAEHIIAQKTRNFAKRQLTWYRGMKGVRHMSDIEIASNFNKWREIC